MTSWLWGIAALLVLWAGVAAMRRRAEYGERRTRQPEPRAAPRAPAGGRDDDEQIDWETLEQAEREVKDLDVSQQPDDGFTGDDWGPGAPRKKGFPPIP